jgi:hypothetical protein
LRSDSGGVLAERQLVIVNRIVSGVPGLPLEVGVAVRR